MRDLTAPMLQDTKSEQLAGAPRRQAGNSSCSNAADSLGRRATPVCQKGKAVSSCSGSTEAFNKVSRVRTGKVRQAKLLTETHCLPWQQVGF